MLAIRELLTTSVLALLATGCEFANDIGSCIGGHSYTGRCRSAAGSEHSFGYGSGCGVACEPSGSYSGLTRSGVLRNDSALESIPKARPHTMLLRAVVVKIFVEFGGDAVFHSPADSIAREASSQTFSETGCALSVLAGSISGLSNGRSRYDSPHRPLTHDRLFPVFSIGMLLIGSGSICRSGEQRQDEDALAYSHNSFGAIG